MRERQTEVLVVGAGPVGLLAAMVLAEAGIRVEIIDREQRTATRSYACALHPQTLDLLDRFGLATALLPQGRRIQRMAFYEGPTRCAEIHFAGASQKFPFLLALPQSALEAALETALLRKPERLSVLWNHRFDDVKCEESEVIAGVERLGGTGTGYIVPHWETVVLARLPIRARFLLAADGHSSLVRQRLGIEYEHLASPQFFAAVEFTSAAEPGDEVRVVLDETTTNVLWPLPGNKFRWTFQLTRAEAPLEFPEKARGATQLSQPGREAGLRHWVQEISRRRAPWFAAAVDEITWCTQVAFESGLAKEFGRGPCWLAGDAAHQTGPVGMQSMNVGLQEAAALACSLRQILQDAAPADLLAQYNQTCRKSWRRLLGLSGPLQPAKEVTDWVRQRASRLLPCLPAGPDELNQVAAQLGLGIGMEAEPFDQSMINNKPL